MAVNIEIRGYGEPLALLHGWGLNGAVWNDIADELAEKFQLHIVDYAGENIDDLSEDIAKKLPLQCNLLGWSLGGQIALNIAHRHPAKISKLILLATTPRFTQSADWPNAMSGAALNDFALRLASNYRATIRSFLGLQTLIVPNAKSIIAQLQSALSQRGEPDATDLSAGLEILRTNDMRDVVKNIQHQTLIIQGDKDMLTPEPAARWLAQVMPQSEFQLIHGAAHAPFLSHRKEFMERVLDFLTR